ncbi:copper chaperone PCu(A)C [Kitasatospora cathayae]|uniref:Copper chaperone PCu(A)C n=1 Tax=Kitasatospora cathayae TaxID=3004092 RepID=A0ABY7Q4T6_9ACTN|nr:copper chaperone PCu(A)C [Kitasatospora sp. HUAS 3-15]WBP87736.1 copper chaperone PCu(A)C [Kitasatospora sp. HUAS 3-15]
MTTAVNRRFRRSALAGAVLATVLGGGAILAACGTGGDGGSGDRAAAGPAKLSVADPYIPLPPAGGMGAGYLTVRNDGGPDELVKVSSPEAGSVTMHRSTASTMEQVDSLDVPAHGTLRLARGGTHLMIMDWQKAPALGDELELDLTFAKSGTISVKVPVKELTYRPGQS